MNFVKEGTKRDAGTGHLIFFIVEKEKDENHPTKIEVKSLKTMECHQEGKRVNCHIEGEHFQNT